MSSNGQHIGDWYCARSDMGGLCYVILDSLESKSPLFFDLPLTIPASSGANPQACFMVGTPSSDMERAVARATQLGLAAHGFELGIVDGLIGPRSRAAIADFAERSGATLPEGGIDEVYRLIFGTLPLPDGVERRAPICIALNLKPLPERVTPRASEPPVDEMDEADEEDKINCDPPLVLNRRGIACIPSPDLIELPRLEFPTGIVMPGLE